MENSRLEEIIRMRYFGRLLLTVAASAASAISCGQKQNVNGTYAKGGYVCAVQDETITTKDGEIKLVSWSVYPGSPEPGEETEFFRRLVADTVRPDNRTADDEAAYKLMDESTRPWRR